MAEKAKAHQPSAFPVYDHHGDGRRFLADEGMTLCDYFAGAALQGLLANPKLQPQILKQGQSWIESSAWAWADEMMKVRSK